MSTARKALLHMLRAAYYVERGIMWGATYNPSPRKKLTIMVGVMAAGFIALCLVIAGLTLTAAKAVIG